MKHQTSGWPRVGCLVPGCPRGTTRNQPNADGEQGDYVCANHWRTVPKDWKRRLGFFRAGYTRAERRGDEEKMMRFGRDYWSMWTMISRSLKGEGLDGDQMPQMMKAALKQDGLL